jgi:hypothetical protein
LQAPKKFTQIGIFGLKIYHLATLACRRIKQLAVNGLLEKFYLQLGYFHIQNVEIRKKTFFQNLQTLPTSTYRAFK